MDDEEGGTCNVCGGGLRYGERHRKCGDAVMAAVAAERERCAAWVDKRREEFMRTFGHQDPETGTWEYGTGPYATAKREYECELAEIAEGLRALNPTTPAPGER